MTSLWKAESSSIMGRCPSCGKQFELHAIVGQQGGLRVGDTAVCIGCASVLVLEELPYEFRLMTEKEVEELDHGTRKLLDKAQADIREDLARIAAKREIENSQRR